MSSDRLSLEQLVEVVRHHTSRDVVRSYPGSGREPVRLVHVPAIEELISRVLQVVRVGGSVSARRDGWSSTTPGNGSPGGGKGGGKLLAVRDEHGEVDLVPTSSTEAAAIDPGRRDDPVALQAAEALALLDQLASVLEGLDRVVQRFDRLRNVADVEDPPMCWLAQSRYQLPYDLVWDVREDLTGRKSYTTDFGGQLDVPLDVPRRVCNFVYRFVHNHQRLPSRDEMIEYSARRSVKVRG